MNIDKISAGENLPHEINVVIEIPELSDPVKYELDKDSGAMFVDRFMSTAMFYPCNYGFVPQTLSEDEDPVDVLVISPSRLLMSSVVACRPIGMLKMTDEKGVDAKILAVPISKICKMYENVNSHQDLPQQLLATISHFFEHYKDLEEGKWVKIDGWVGRDEALLEITASVERYQG